MLRINNYVKVIHIFINKLFHYYIHKLPTPKFLLLEVITYGYRVIPTKWSRTITTTIYILNIIFISKKRLILEDL